MRIWPIDSCIDCVLFSLDRRDARLYKTGWGEILKGYKKAMTGIIKKTLRSTWLPAVKRLEFDRWSGHRMTVWHGTVILQGGLQLDVACDGRVLDWHHPVLGGDRLDCWGVGS